MASLPPYSTLTRKSAAKMKAKRIKAKRAKPRVRKEVVRLTGEAMTELRWQAYERAGGDREHPATRVRCELAWPGICTQAPDWYTGELSHLRSRGAGGGDTLDNVLFACAACHMAAHNCNGKPIQVTKRAAKGAANAG